MNAERLERLKKRYGWEEWGEVPAGRKETSPLAARVDEGLFPGWKLQRTDPLSGEGLPGGIRTMWVRDEGAVLSVEIWQCASPAAARELLLQVLEQFESPRVERAQGAAAVGEVAFVHGEQTLLFARGNLVVLVRNAGARIVSVLDAARTLDDGLRRQELLPQ
jgi:hypothetical protein